RPARGGAARRGPRPAAAGDPAAAGRGLAPPSPARSDQQPRAGPRPWLRLTNVDRLEAASASGWRVLQRERSTTATLPAATLTDVPLRLWELVHLTAPSPLRI